MNCKLILAAVFVCLISIRCGWAQSFHSVKAPGPQPGSVFVYPERISLMQGGMFAAERGIIFVPLNRSKPGSDVIGVEFYRFPRSSKADAGTPPVFLLNGGPGFPGLEKPLQQKGTFEQQLMDFLDVSDLVVVGQRGIGSSKPDTVIEMTPAPGSAGQPYDEAAEIEAFQDNLRRERQFWMDQGIDLAGFNVLEAAADVRDVASALGYPKIILVGGSFGSHWGMAIMRTYPELVERAALNGLEGPDHTWDHPGWIWNVYRRVAEDAEASATLANLIPEGGLVQTMASIVETTTQAPRTVVLNTGTRSEKTVLIDGHAIRRLARGFTGGLQSWPADVIRMHHGDFEQAARTTLMKSAVRPRQYSTASFWMLDSGSGISAERRARFESDPAMEIIGSTFWDYAHGSPIWEFTLDDSFRTNFETDIPTVLVQGTWDTSTPYENALELAPFFRNGKLVTVKRGSHGAMGEAPRADPTFKPALMEFLKTGDLSGIPNAVDLPEPRWSVPTLDSGN